MGMAGYLCIQLWVLPQPRRTPLHHPATLTHSPALGHTLGSRRVAGKARISKTLTEDLRCAGGGFNAGIMTLSNTPVGVGVTIATLQVETLS